MQVRELVNDFYGSRYASCLNHLTRLRPMLDLDPYIHAHLNTLYASVSMTLFHPPPPPPPAPSPRPFPLPLPLSVP